MKKIKVKMKIRQIQDRTEIIEIPDDSDIFKEAEKLAESIYEKNMSLEVEVINVLEI